MRKHADAQEPQTGAREETILFRRIQSQQEVLRVKLLGVAFLRRISCQDDSWAGRGELRLRLKRFEWVFIDK